MLTSECTNYSEHFSKTLTQISNNINNSSECSFQLKHSVSPATSSSEESDDNQIADKLIKPIKVKKGKNKENKLQSGNPALHSSYNKKPNKVSNCLRQNAIVCVKDIGTNYFDSSNGEEKKSNKKTFKTKEAVVTSKKRKASINEDENKQPKQSDFSKKLANLKKYLRTCGYHVRNYKKLFKDCMTVKSKEDKLLFILRDLGVDGRPTLEKCKKVRLKREQAQEVAELDCSNIIQARRHPCSASTDAIKTPKVQYSFGDLSVDSEASVSDKSIHEFQPRKRQRISSSDDDK